MRKKVRFFSMALAILMILPMLAVFPVTVSADPVVYEVSNCEELVAAIKAHNTSQDPTETILLTADIVLDPTAFNTTGDRFIYGTFDGQGHTIYNMTNDVKSLVWPYGNCVIENFTVSNLTAPEGEEITVTEQTSIIGSEPVASEIKAGETAIIRNVTNYRSITSGINNYGGLFTRKCSMAGTLRFENCVNYGDYKITSDSNYQLGGFVGYLETGTLEFVGCVNSGDITGGMAGGFVAVYRYDSNKGVRTAALRMTDCVNNGTITGWNGKGYGLAGGFIGGYNSAGSGIQINMTIEMTNCVNTGNILTTGSGSQTYGIGGLIGLAGKYRSGRTLSITLNKCRVENCTIDTNGTNEYAAPLIGKCEPGSTKTYTVAANSCSVSDVDVIGGTARKLIGVADASDSMRPVATACEFKNVTEDGSAEWNADAMNLVKCVLMTPYAEIADGEEMLEVDFENATYMELGLSENENYNDLDVALDGGTVTFKSLSTDSKRGIWGAKLPAAVFPLSAGAKYTVYFDLEMDDGMRCVFFPDGAQGIAILQKNTYTIYQKWANFDKENYPTEANWANKTDYGKDLTKFAIELDYDTGTLTLYGRNQNGTYCFINEATGLTFESDVLGCYFYAGNASGKKVTVSNLWIEKGLNIEELDRDAIGFTDYQGYDDNALLQTVNFNQAGWDPGFADDNNKGADVEILSDDSVKFTLHNGDNYRAMWGAKLVDTLPLLGTIKDVTGAEYTFVFDVEFGNDEMRVGIMPDAENALMIQGDGSLAWVKWNTQQGTISEKWTDHTDVNGSTQTFAVVMDYTECAYALYVKRANGTFEYVTSRAKNHIWDTRTTMNFRFRVDRKTGTPDDTFTVTVSNVMIYKGLTFADRRVMETVAGASVRLDDPTGLRFTGYVGKDFFDEYKSAYGDENVKIGMIITPTKFLADNGIDFTIAALDACEAISGMKYAKIEAVTILDAGSAYQINCVLADVQKANYGHAFSAITYIEINTGDQVVYFYSGYNETENSRSIESVAEAALADLKDEATDDYKYEVIIDAETTKYSPYTDAERAILTGFAPIA